MKYEEYLAECQRLQRDYITGERRRMEKALKIWRRYDAGMKALGLHPLALLEIDDRKRELDRMWATVHITHGDTVAARAAYASRPA